MADGGLPTNRHHLLKIAGITVVAAFFVCAAAVAGFYLAAFRAGHLAQEQVAVRHHAEEILKFVAADQQLLVDGRAVTLPKNETRNWVENYIRDYTGQKDLRLRNDKIDEFLNKVAASTNVMPVNAKFQFKDNRAEVFIPSVVGKRLDVIEAHHALVTAIHNAPATIILPIENTEPEITLEKINSLGITTLVGRGESNFVGSSTARIQNIKVGSARFNGIILKPGENFSFNTILGEVTEQQGYAAEKVIKGHALVYELGGGLCQVATTMFRAAIYAGFPILERRPHSFPVHYYNPQGFDATIYPGVTDLRFTNNFDHHILIQTHIVGTKLSFEIYGTDDGRKVTVDGPHQYDLQPSGAMKAYFTRVIAFADNTQDKKTFYSNYNAPSLYPLEHNPLE